MRDVARRVVYLALTYRNIVILSARASYKCPAHIRSALAIPLHRDMLRALSRIINFKNGLDPCLCRIFILFGSIHKITPIDFVALQYVEGGARGSRAFKVAPT